MGDKDDFDFEQNELMRAVFEAIKNSTAQVNNYTFLYNEMKQMMDAGFTREEAFSLLKEFTKLAGVK